MPMDHSSRTAGNLLGSSGEDLSWTALRGTSCELKRSLSGPRFSPSRAGRSRGAGPWKRSSEGMPLLGYRASGMSQATPAEPAAPANGVCAQCLCRPPSQGRVGSGSLLVGLLGRRALR